MNILCKLFGHRPVEGYAHDVPYLRIRSVSTDGIGRRHAYLYVECVRCHDEYHIANIHLPENPPEGNQR